MRGCIHAKQQFLHSIPKKYFQKEDLYSNEWKIKDIETFSVVLAEVACNLSIKQVQYLPVEKLQQGYNWVWKRPQNMVWSKKGQISYNYSVKHHTRM